MSVSGTYGSLDPRLVKLMGTNATQRTSLGEMSDLTDGFQWFGANACLDISASTAAVITRTAAGDYSLVRTAGGAETHYFVCALDLQQRTTANKGLKITDVTASYKITVADATSVDFVLNQAVYVDRVANAVTASGGTLAYDTNHNTAAKRLSATAGVNPHLMTNTLGTPAFVSTDSALIVAELAVVLPNTSVITFNGFGVHFTYNYV